MTKEEKEEILNSYKWIKVPRYKEEDVNNPDVDWKESYQELLKHHIEETSFLINKVRKIAKDS
jgi:hypothetical protein